MENLSELALVCFRTGEATSEAAQTTSNFLLRQKVGKDPAASLKIGRGAGYDIRIIGHSNRQYYGVLKLKDDHLLLESTGRGHAYIHDGSTMRICEGAERIPLIESTSVRIRFGENPSNEWSLNPMTKAQARSSETRIYNLPNFRQILDKDPSLLSTAKGILAADSSLLSHAHMETSETLQAVLTVFKDARSNGRAICPDLPLSDIFSAASTLLDHSQKSLIVLEHVLTADDYDKAWAILEAELNEAADMETAQTSSNDESTNGPVGEAAAGELVLETDTDDGRLELQTGTRQFSGLQTIAKAQNQAQAMLQQTPASLVQVNFPAKIGKTKSKDLDYGVATLLYVPTHERVRFLRCFHEGTAGKILTRHKIKTRYKDATGKSKDTPLEIRMSNSVQLPFKTGGVYQDGTSTGGDASTAVNPLTPSAASTPDIPLPSLPLLASLKPSIPSDQPLLSDHIKSMRDIEGQQSDAIFVKILLGRILQYARYTGAESRRHPLEDTIIALISSPEDELRLLYSSPAISIDDGMKAFALECLTQLDVTVESVEAHLSETMHVTSADYRSLDKELLELLRNPGTYIGVIPRAIAGVLASIYPGVGAGKGGPIRRVGEHYDRMDQLVNRKWQPARDAQVWYFSSKAYREMASTIAALCPGAVAITKAADLGYSHLYTPSDQLLQVSQHFLEFFFYLALGGQARLDRYKKECAIDVWRSSDLVISSGGNGGEGYRSGGRNVGKGLEREQRDLVDVYDRTKGIVVVRDGHHSAWTSKFYSDDSYTSVQWHDPDSSATNLATARIFASITGPLGSEDSYYKLHPPAAIYEVPPPLQSWLEICVYVIEQDETGEDTLPRPLFRQVATGGHLTQGTAWLIKAYAQISTLGDDD